MLVVNVQEAKTRLSKLLEQVRSGEDIVIAKAGIPIASLVPYVPTKRKNTPPGAMKGEIWMADDFDKPLNNMFECLGN